ncbi:hypothetical protein V5F59_07655 [Xanthobacter autotrophicus DSM 431]|uniref:hypothetical protein n=1 Tax=Xanthobacter nonsaccharivorans TaxID=3119912 RepID=UPI0037280086
MYNPHVKIPLVQSLAWSFQWSAAVVLRHPKVLAIYVGAGVVCAFLWFVAPGVGSILDFLYTLALIPLALLTHNEILRGPSHLDAQTLGEGYGRVLGYLLDVVVLGVVAALSAIVPALLISLAFMEQSSNYMSTGAALLLFGVIVVAIIVATSRLALRLPARAIGSLISWREAWSMGEGHMLALCAGPIAIALVFSVVLGGAYALLPNSMEALVSMLVSPAQVIVTCAFLSVAYGQLRQTPAAPPAAGKAAD